MASGVPIQNPMQGFKASDVEKVTPEDFVHAAEVLSGEKPVMTESDPCEKCKRVIHILRTMAAAFKAQEQAAEQFRQMQANGKLKRI